MKTWADDILNIAHRGASGHAPENTMAAFRRAFDMGADGVEFDVQLTKDGHPVIFHDETLQRTTNGSGALADSSLSDIAQLDAGSWFAPDFAGERIPSLHDLLEFAKGRFLLNIEIKTTPFPRHIVELVRESILYFDMIEQCLITSFQVEAVVWSIELLPNCRSGLLCKKISKDIWQGDWDFVAAKSNVINPIVMRNAEEHQKSLVVWTVNEDDEMQHLYELGARRLITNFPDRYKKVIEKLEKNIDWK